MSNVTPWTSAWRRLRFQVLINLYPPYLGAGVRVMHVANDFHVIEVQMRLRRWNQNYVGTHFGGSLFAMDDPFYMLMLIELLGRGTRSGTRRRPSASAAPGEELFARDSRFRPSESKSFGAPLMTMARVETAFTVSITDQQGEVVAEVEKLLSVRRRPASQS